VARIRTIKPEFYRHHDLYSAEKESGLPLRLAFSGLWLCADKEGRFKWNPNQLKLDVLPYDELDFEKVLNALEKNDFLKKYEVEKKFYGVIPSFKEHQRITGSEAIYESKIPSPPMSYENGNTLETPKNNIGINKDDRKGKGKGNKERERSIGKEEPVKFDLELIYKKDWEEYKTILNGQASKLSEIIFIKWKEFVDFIKQNNYDEIFQAKFVSPIDFGVLITQKGFLPEKWKGVIEGILATGVTQQQNLFFRIPQYLEYENKKHGTNRSSNITNRNSKTTLNTGNVGATAFGKL